MSGTLFREKSLERIASPDKLDNYLKASGSSAWLVLLALALMLAAVVVWCFFGSIPATVQGVGYRTDQMTVCFFSVNESTAISPGMRVRFTPEGGERDFFGTVELVRDPMPAAEAAAKAGAGWLSMPGDWVRPVILRTEGTALPIGEACSVQLILEEYRPVDLLLGGR